MTPATRRALAEVYGVLIRNGWGTPVPSTRSSGVGDAEGPNETRIQLDERERAVLRLRLGFEGDRPMSLGEIGAILGIPRSQVRRLESEAAAKLQAIVSHDGEDEG